MSVDYGDAFDGGMEYLQLVVINTPNMADDAELDITVMHEVAHQWFYSAIGNNQYQEPWLDEALTTYASYLAYNGGTIDENGANAHQCEENLTASLADFESQAACYGDVIYDGGAEMLAALKDELGQKAFYKGLATYYKNFQFGIATTADFIRTMEKVSGQNLKSFFTTHGVDLDETR